MGREYSRAQTQRGILGMTKVEATNGGVEREKRWTKRCTVFEEQAILFGLLGSLHYLKCWFEIEGVGRKEKSNRSR